MNSPDQQGFLFNSNLKDRFLGEEWSDSPPKLFRDIDTPDDVWQVKVFCLLTMSGWKDL